MPDIKIGKFDILATFTYAQALRHDVPDGEARQRGIVAAIMGAKTKSGHTVDHHAEKDRAANLIWRGSSQEKLRGIPRLSALSGLGPYSCIPAGPLSSTGLTAGLRRFASSIQVIDRIGVLFRPSVEQVQEFDEPLPQRCQ